MPSAPLALTRLGHALADLVIGQQRARRQGRARRITIDVDPTDDPTHGQQEFAFFNGHYDTWCYLPLLGFVTFNDEAEQYLRLRPAAPRHQRGQAAARSAGCGTLFRKLRAAFPGARLRVRLDGGFAGNDLLAFLEAEGVEYVVALGSNRRLDKRAQRLMGRARMRSKASGETEHVFGETRYAAAEVEAQTAGDHQGRGGAPSGAAAQEQSPVRRDQSARTPPSTSTRSTARAGTSRTGSRSSRPAWPWTG